MLKKLSRTSVGNIWEWHKIRGPKVIHGHTENNRSSKSWRVGKNKAHQEGLRGRLGKEHS